MVSEIADAGAERNADLPLVWATQITNVKIALTDDQYTYEPSYNLRTKAPLLGISRPIGQGKAKISWNLKTDAVSLEYTIQHFKVAAHKEPGVPVPRLAASIEKSLTF